MKKEHHWWDGPWPWLIYLVTYGIPWFWAPPSFEQILFSILGLCLFLPVYIYSFHFSGKALLTSIGTMVALAMALIPVGGGWSSLAIYPAMQAARIRPPYIAIWVIIFSILAFFIAGLISRQPLTWWLPSLMMPALIAGAALSREAFYDRTQALLATQEEVRRLAGMAERERMARDLHDVIGRTLTLVALKADLVARCAATNGDLAASEARFIAVQARAGLSDIRSALAGHAGGSLTNELTVSANALNTAGIDTKIEGHIAAIPPNAGALLAMTLREAVTNVIRHAAASQCLIRITSEGMMTMLIVSDDGKGGPIVEGNGLMGMRQRLIAAGGTLVVSADGSGTKLSASVPT
jgi:two-component system, NarL family, sensor histidine kinase DesK